MRQNIKWAFAKHLKVARSRRGFDSLKLSVENFITSLVKAEMLGGLYTECKLGRSIKSTNRAGVGIFTSSLIYAYLTPPKIRPRWPLENCTSAGCDLVSGTGLVTKITQPATEHNS